MASLTHDTSFHAASVNQILTSCIQFKDKSFSINDCLFVNVDNSQKWGQYCISLYWNCTNKGSSFDLRKCFWVPALWQILSKIVYVHHSFNLHVYPSLPVCVSHTSLFYCLHSSSCLMKLLLQLEYHGKTGIPSCSYIHEHKP